MAGCQGANMRRGCRIGDYVVTVGTVVLANDNLQDNRLVVRLLNIESYGRGDENSCGDQRYPVRVRTENEICILVVNSCEI